MLLLFMLSLTTNHVFDQTANTLYHVTSSYLIINIKTLVFRLAGTTKFGHSMSWTDFWNVEILSRHTMAGFCSSNQLNLGRLVGAMTCRGWRSRWAWSWRGRWQCRVRSKKMGLGPAGAMVGRGRRRRRVLGWRERWPAWAMSGCVEEEDGYGVD